MKIIQITLKEKKNINLNLLNKISIKKKKINKNYNFLKTIKDLL